MKSYRSNKRVQKSPYQNVDIHQWKLRWFFLFIPDSLKQWTVTWHTYVRVPAGFINTRRVHKGNMAIISHSNFWIHFFELESWMKSYRSNKRVQKSPYQNVDIHQWKLRWFFLFIPDSLKQWTVTWHTYVRVPAGFINTRSTDHIFVYHQATNVVCVFVIYAI